MSDKTGIEWAEATWNPLRGTLGRWHCVRVSPGCDYCYAATLNKRFGGPDYARGADQIRLDERALTLPGRWRTPRRVFVCSMSDLFLPEAAHFLDAIHDAMLAAPQHTYLILTKRPVLARRYYLRRFFGQPLPENWWVGTTIESDQFAFRADLLREIPAAVRWVSAEPLLGPLTTLNLAGLSWLVAGGESSGPPERRLVKRCDCHGATAVAPTSPDVSAWTCDCEHGPPDEGSLNGYHCLCHGTRWRPTAEALTWVRDLRARCRASGVAWFFKQWGGPTPKAGGRLLDGREWNEYPVADAMTHPSQPAQAALDVYPTV